MSDISLDLDNALIGTDGYADIRIVNGDQVLTSDANNNGTHYILQNILQNLRLFYGEWFMDLEAGVPYYQQIMVKNPLLSNVDVILQNAILNTPGVQLLTQYSSSLNQTLRTLSVSFQVQTISGTVSYSNTILSNTSGGGA